MTEGTPYLPWSRAEDRAVVEEMLKDPQAKQWDECFEFVKKCVQRRAKNIPQDHWDDIVQDAVIKIHRSLLQFQHQCALRTWIFGIVHSCIIDEYRKYKRVKLVTSLPEDPHDNLERDGEASSNNHMLTVEDECIIRDELGKGIKALQEYVSKHTNLERNRRILDIVILEGRSLEEAAEAVGCSAPVAGYVVRSAQRYARERRDG